MVRITSFDIFDTCLVRKCGTPENFFDVFSLRAFNHEPPEWARQEFVAARKLAESKLWEENPHYTLQDIWAEMDWTHQFLKSKAELCRMEQELEQEMLVPVLKMRDMVNECRKHGDKIIFISDMYLSSDFLIDVMREHGFYQEGDSLYVSCECQAVKWNGELFRYVRDKEGLQSFRHWHHYGDNKVGDYKAPKKLGIRCTLINHEYTPYQKQWKDNDYYLGFKYPSILAGLGRALHYSTERTTHTDFVLDIIAPFYCSLVYRIMRDAEQRGIKRLYFCARDAWPLYKIANQYASQFPDIESHYLYISRKSLYEGEDKAKLQYFIQEGIATKTDKVAMVDVRSQGKTQRYLSDFLIVHGYKEIFGYYFEMFTKVELKYHNAYYCEVNKPYQSLNNNTQRLLMSWQLYEDFFSLNDYPKTIDYTIDEHGNAIPVFSTNDDEQNSRNIDAGFWMNKHNEILQKYSEWYMANGLYLYSNRVFENVATITLVRFFERPEKHYLCALEQFYAYNDNIGRYVPYVGKHPIWKLILHKGHLNIWRRATIINSLPKWTSELLYRLKN